MFSLYVRNISQCAPVSDYEYVAMVNAETIGGGTIKGHKRAEGWRELVRKIAEQGGENDKKER